MRIENHIKFIKDCTHCRGGNNAKTKEVEYRFRGFCDLLSGKTLSTHNDFEVQKDRERDLSCGSHSSRIYNNQKPRPQGSIVSSGLLWRQRLEIQVLANICRMGRLHYNKKDEHCVSEASKDKRGLAHRRPSTDMLRDHQGSSRGHDDTQNDMGTGIYELVPQDRGQKGEGRIFQKWIPRDSRKGPYGWEMAEDPDHAFNISSITEISDLEEREYYQRLTRSRLVDMLPEGRENKTLWEYIFRQQISRTCGLYKSLRSFHQVFTPYTTADWWKDDVEGGRTHRSDQSVHGTQRYKNNTVVLGYQRHGYGGSRKTVSRVPQCAEVGTSYQFCGCSLLHSAGKWGHWDSRTIRGAISSANEENEDILDSVLQAFRDWGMLAGLDELPTVLLKRWQEVMPEG